MKLVKILFGFLGAVWAVALLPKVFGGYAGRSHLAFSHHAGAIVGILIAAAISISLFRSAFSD
jgi:hypothetical protein